MQVLTIIFPPVRLPTNLIACSDRKPRRFDPTYALADQPVEFWRLDSNSISYGPSDVPASVPHSNTGPSAACIRFYARQCAAE